MAVESNSSVHVAKLGKVPCCACGKEVSIVGRYQMADYKEICKECVKKVSPIFDPQVQTADDYTAHVKQLEDGKKLYDKYFAGNKSVKKFAPKMFRKQLLINEEVSLMCVDRVRGGFLMFGGTHFYVVYRLADITSYTKGTELIKTQNGNAGQSYIYFDMHNVAGVSSFKLPVSSSAYNKISKYLKKSMGLSGLKGIKNSINRIKEQAQAAGAIANSFKEGVSDPDNAEAVDQASSNIMAEAEKAFYAGREELVKKADDAIKAVLG